MNLIKSFYLKFNLNAGLGCLIIFSILTGSTFAQGKTGSSQKNIDPEAAKRKTESKQITDVAMAGYSKFDSKILKSAVIDLEKAIELDPNNSMALSLLALLYSHFTYRDWHFGIKQSEYINRAADYSFRAVKIAPNDFWALKAQAAALLVNEMRDAAIVELNKAIKINDKDPELWYLLACASKGSLIDSNSESGKHAEKTLALNPDFLWLLEDQMMLMLLKNDIPGAASLFDKIEKKYNTIAEIHFYRGLFVLHKNGKLSEAKEHFKKFVSEDTKSNLSAYVQQFLK